MNYDSVVRTLLHDSISVYSVAVANFLASKTPTPEITAHPLQTTTKYGFGVNLEQPLTDWLGLFSRWGWNEGQHESFAYTEVDQTVQCGADVVGALTRTLPHEILCSVSEGIPRHPGVTPAALP